MLRLLVLVVACSLMVSSALHAEDEFLFSTAETKELVKNARYVLSHRKVSQLPGAEAKGKEVELLAKRFERDPRTYTPADELALWKYLSWARLATKWQPLQSSIDPILIRTNTGARKACLTALALRAEMQKPGLDAKVVAAIQSRLDEVLEVGSKEMTAREEAMIFDTWVWIKEGKHALPIPDPRK